MLIKANRMLSKLHLEIWTSLTTRVNNIQTLAHNVDMFPNVNTHQSSACWEGSMNDVLCSCSINSEWVLS